MKTPTLIVRLTGLYLLSTGIQTLFQLHKIAGNFMSIPGVTTQQDNLLGDMKVYAWLTIIVGIVATCFAGFLARLLTFDSGPN